MAREHGEGFLSRWSRLSIASRREQDGGEVEPASEATPLPSPESLDGTSDYKAFLDDHVSPELRRAALRRAWATDEAIVSFRSFAEYDWDFNAPGYGTLEGIGERVADMVVASLSTVDEPKETARPEEKPDDQA